MTSVWPGEAQRQVDCCCALLYASANYYELQLDAVVVQLLLLHAVLNFRRVLIFANSCFQRGHSVRFVLLPLVNKVIMLSWRLLDANLNTRQVQWAFCLLYLFQILLFRVTCHATRSCLQSDPENIRVATVFSESVVHARLLAVHRTNDTDLTQAEFHVSRVFKGSRSGRNTVFTTDVLESDLQCIRNNASCLVFVNSSTSIPHAGVRNNTASSGHLSRLTLRSRRALRYVRMHICQSHYCSK